MPNGAIAGGAVAPAAAAAAAIANAIKASGVIVRLETADFETILNRAEKPLVVCARGGFFSTNYQYLMGYKGLAFYCKSATPLTLPASVETIQAKKIWIPA
ncbi:MAG: hypothetical protein AMJ75_03795 [Phycisphaerae bacterium SM1_79]|nr:MAG: hypothetical protein AMJ75_03795 [Phycisphaerae bacterium SM1_79]